MSDSRITGKQSAAIAALLAGLNLDEVARSCGIAPATLYRWRKLPAFVTRYTEARDDLLEATINKLGSIGMVGVEALRRVAVDKDAPAGALVGAGRAILEVRLKARETLEFGERLARLEASLKAGE